MQGHGAKVLVFGSLDLNPKPPLLHQVKRTLQCYGEGMTSDEALSLASTMGVGIAPDKSSRMTPIFSL